MREVITVYRIKKIIRSLKPLNIKDSDNIHILRIRNNYGTNKNVFKLKINYQKNNYFIKISDQQINGERKKISNYLNIPKLYYQKSIPLGIIEIFEYIEGSLFTDILLKKENKKEKHFGILELEDKKNQYLLSMYLKTMERTPYANILHSKGNNLFYKRLKGDRFKEYYENSKFENLFDKTLIINGLRYPSVNEILNDIEKKYELINKNLHIRTIYGHGDIHHQNILIEKETSKLFFIDNEYNSQIPINMEIAKPYYIDLLGNYFFFFNDVLSQMISVKKYEINKKNINIKLKINFIPKLRLAITKNKIKIFKKLLDTCNDPISVNNYLVMCHILSRNPNDYDKDIIPIFLAYVPILNSFNISKPEELFIF